MGFFDKFRKSAAPAPAVPAAAPPGTRPALRFNNPTPGGPHIFTFDGLERLADGTQVLVLDLEGQGATAAGQAHLLTALAALEQNPGLGCLVCIKEEDYPPLDALIHQHLAQFPQALPLLNFGIS